MKDLLMNEIGPETECCMNCKHFYQHYVKDRRTGYASPTYYGHCTCPRLKQRSISDLCERFSKQTGTKG